MIPFERRPLRVRNRAIFLDRDGVLNATEIREGRPYPPKSTKDVHILPGVKDACIRLKSAGFLLLVVSNQPDIARGTLTIATVEAINEVLRQSLFLDDVRLCPHDDGDGCDCRKPRPGLLLAAAQDWDIDLSKSYMVGDRWRDIDAGRAAGCRTVFIDYGYAERRPSNPDVIATSLASALPVLIE